MNIPNSTPDLLVTGASGQLGQAVLGHLLDTLHIPASRIAAATRHTEKLDKWAARGVTVRKADFDDPTSLIAAFAGVKRLLIVSTDSLGEAGKRLAQHTAAVNAASKAGVAHIVYTSLPHAETSAVSFAPDHAGTERAIAASGVPGWTILRNSWYAENLFMSLPQALASGTWYTAAAAGGTSYLERDEFALAAATALASDYSGKRTLTLGGSTAYTADEIAGLVRNASGKPLHVEHVPVEGLVQGMIGAGLPEPVARTIASFDAAAAEGSLEVTSGDFKVLTGREPKPFADWFARNAQALVASRAA